MSSKYDYDLNLDAMKSDFDRFDSSKEHRGINTEKYVILPKDEGVLVVRILPPSPEQLNKMLFQSTRLHYLEYPNGQKRVFHCLKDLQGSFWKGSCPVCNYYNYIYRKSDEASSKEAGEALRNIGRGYKPVETYFYNVIVRKETNLDTGEISRNVGPKVLRVGKSLHGLILKNIFGDIKLEAKALGNIAHPIKGRDLKIVKKIKKSPEGSFPNYESSHFDDVSLLGTDTEIDNWMKKLWDLSLERTSDLKSFAELQHQIDIIQGKVEEDGFGSNEEFVLPVMKGQTNSAKASVSVPVEVVAEVKSKPKKVVEKAPFEDSDGDFDASLAENDWVAELHKAVNG